MTRRRFLRPVRAVGLVFACACLVGSTARSDTSSTTVANCGWTRVPTDGVIAASGKYFLEQDVRTDRQIGVKVTADDVVIDLRGHSLRCQGTPRKGVFGIVANGRKNVTIRNGVVGGFWFNVHLTASQHLTIENVRFDDVAYIGINVAQSKDVTIHRNHFMNFRYDIEKPKDKYLIGVNIGAENVVISNNDFHSSLPEGDPQAHDIETVFVLLSAGVSQRCMIGLNQMKSDRPLPRSYGIWVAKDAQATIVYNDVRNMKYAVCLATDASATISHNRISADSMLTPNERFHAYGVYAKAPTGLSVIDNTFEGLREPAWMPQEHVYQNNIVKYSLTALLQGIRSRSHQTSEHRTA